MLIEEAFAQILNANVALDARINGRSYPGILPQEVDYPAVAFRTVGRESIMTLADGRSELIKKTIRTFSADKGPGNYESPKIVDDLLIKALEGFAGIVTNDTVSPVESMEIQGIFAVPGSSADGYDDRTQTNQVISEFEVWGVEPVS